MSVVAASLVPTTGWLRLLTDRGAWRSCLHAVMLLPLGIVNATVTLTGWAVVAAGLTSHVWARLLPSHAAAQTTGREPRSLSRVHPQRRGRADAGASHQRRRRSRGSRQPIRHRRHHASRAPSTGATRPRTTAGVTFPALTSAATAPPIATTCTATRRGVAS